MSDPRCPSISPSLLKDHILNHPDQPDKPHHLQSQTAEQLHQQAAQVSAGMYTSDINSSFRAAIRPAQQTDPHDGGHLQGRQDEAEQPGKAPRAHINPRVFQFQSGDIARLSEETRESEYRDKPCSYCSSTTTVIRHHHFSTMEQRAFARKWTKGDFMCPVCQKLEPTIQSCNTTKRIILTDSTLYGVWNDNSMPKKNEHLEIECIVGARVRDLTRALVKNVLKYSNRLEIIAIAGINNVGKNDDARSIIEEFKEMKEVVKEHSMKHKHNPPSYVAISTLILPPKFCSFSVPANVPELAEWVPRPGFRDRYETIKQVNLAIKAMNEEEQLSWLNLHMQGVKILKSGPQHKYDTRPGTKAIWREKEVFSKLHFTMENKLKIVVYMQNTLKINAKRASISTTSTTKE